MLELFFWKGLQTSNEFYFGLITIVEGEVSLYLNQMFVIKSFIFRIRALIIEYLDRPSDAERRLLVTSHF